MVCFFLVIMLDLVRDFGDCLNFCILLFFNEKKMLKNGVCRNGQLDYTLRVYKVSQIALFLTTNSSSSAFYLIKWWGGES